MTERVIESIVERRGQGTVPLHNLMARKVHRMLLVSSLYDSYTFEEDGQLSEIVFADYLELNLSAAPRVERVSTAEAALEMLKTERFDLVVAMLRMGKMDLADFGARVAQAAPGVPVVVLAATAKEVALIEALGPLPNVDRVFLWNGDQRLFFAIIKYWEDRMNVRRDTYAAGVQCIILVEDSVKFYSSFLPLLYTEVVRQTQHLMSDVVNMTQKLVRMRARPKILLATTFEEAVALYEEYRDFVLCVMTDVAFPRHGTSDPRAGVELAKMVRSESPDRPVLVQSSDSGWGAEVDSIGARFVHKDSPTLLDEVRRFMQDHLGFGDFVFRMENGETVARATDLLSLAEGIRKVPAESLLYHARRNHFSTWLMARTEFDLARDLKPQQVEDFANAEALRGYLHLTMVKHRQRARAAVVAEFKEKSDEQPGSFVRIGRGALGGKGRGLAFMNALLNNYKIVEHIPNVRIFVPRTAVLATGVFDAFMDGPGLRALALSAGVTDEELDRAFLNALLPTEAVRDLRAFLATADYPLAVRSSSLLEDASFQPFAGIYRTFLIPNNHPDLETRLHELLCAVRLVYASAYHADARAYVEATPNRLEEEKMAVVIQQVVGRRHGSYMYPDMAGTARSRNFYPLGGMTAEDGIASVAFGLGNLVVEGHQCLRFSPEHPHKLYQLAGIKEALKNTQREFCALDLGRAPALDQLPHDRRSHLSYLPLAEAEKHGTLPLVASVYSPDDQALHDGMSGPGAPVITFAGVLKHGAFPLAEGLSFLLKVGEAGFSTPVEMEFAACFSESPDVPQEFAFLQVRPLVGGPEIHHLALDQVDPSQAICFSCMALGHGVTDDITDIVYVRPKAFDRGQTVNIAAQIGMINATLRAQKRRYALIGMGRWGSSDRWLGIPVTWAQVSGVACFVETDMQDIRLEPSQGTHFFQNITSLGIGYLSVNFGKCGGWVDYDWLDAQPSAAETEFVRHVSLQAPVQIAIDGQTGQAVIMRPGLAIKSRS